MQGYGVENIPKENGFMFYPNHQGLYDVLATMEVLSGAFFCSSQKRSVACTFSKTGICMHEGIYASTEKILNSLCR